MIRLVVISDSPPTITQYFQPTVTIGCTNSPFADLSLAEETLHDSHVQIVQEQQRYYAINVANDPFATVNGKPFGKKKLNPSDIIQVGNAVIRFECENESPAASTTPWISLPIETSFLKNEKKHVPSKSEEEQLPESEEAQMSNLVDTKELLPIILEKKLMEYAESLEEMEDPPFIFDLTIEEEQQLLASQDSDMLYEDYLNICEELSFDIYNDVTSLESLKSSELTSSKPQLENSVQLPASPPIQQTTHHPLAESLATGTIDSLKEAPIQVPSPSPSLKTPKLSLKDYYLSEYDDVSETNSPTLGDTSSTMPKILISVQNWIIYLKVVGIFTILALIALGLAYFWMMDQSDKEEITASKGVADIAMALTYAQIKNIHPQNQNWLDPEFIRNNLMAVLPSKYFSHADFDTHGQFTNCPYFLRIYTSGDLSQFLVIAQPAPSVLQWLIPRSTIIIDSHAMEMRKTTDLKSLNRLLVNANTLDGTSAVEVSHLVRQGTLISLNSLVNKTENIDFSPPKALGLMRPGAENLVYNAPRYYPLSEELMKKSLDLIEKSASSHDILRLQQELTALKRLPDAVLYISGGIQNAIHVQKALTALSPNEKFLIGYLQINNKGQVFNSHLLIDDSMQEAAIAESNPMLAHSSWQAAIMENLEEAQGSLTLPESSKNTEIPPQGTNIDEDNPLFLQFSALNAFRQQALRPLCDEMISMLNQETHASQKDFEPKIKQLLTKYIDVDVEQQAKIQQSIDGIYRENTHVSAVHFFHLAKAAGIKQPLADYLSHLKQTQTTPEFTQEKLDKNLQKIEKASHWQNFEQEVAELVEILNLERVPDEEALSAFQNAARSRIIQKLNQFILAPEHPLIFQAFDPEYRNTLIHILKMSWITDPDTYDFYLNEFDQRMLPRGSESGAGSGSGSIQSDDGEDEED